MENLIKVTTDELANIITNNGTKATIFTAIYFTDESKSRQKKGKKLVDKLVLTKMRLAECYQNKVNNRIEEGEFVAETPRGLEYYNAFFFKGIKAQDLRLNAYSSETVPTTRYYYEGKGYNYEKMVSLNEDLNFLAPSFFAPKPTVGRGEVSEEKDFHVQRLRLARLIVFKYQEKTYLNVEGLQNYLDNVDEVSEQIKSYVEIA